MSEQQMRTCSKCEEAKPEPEFYKRTHGGLNRRCRSCIHEYNRSYIKNNKGKVNAYAKVYRKENPGIHAAYNKRYAQTEKGKVSRSKAVQTYNKKNPDKERARWSVGNAIRRGKLEAPNLCEKCKRGKKLDAHHDDYSKPLTVRWLCRRCHTDHHIKLKG